MHSDIIIAIILAIVADQATVGFEDTAFDIREEDGNDMLCANLTLTDGYTLETTIIAPFDIDEGDTGWYCNTRHPIQ